MKTSSFFKIFIILILTASCDRPHPAPEIMDPVWSDLNTELSKLEKEKESKEKEVSDIEEVLNKGEQSARDRKKSLASLSDIKNSIFKLNQNILYTQLRIHTRMAQDRTEYMEAYRNKSTWPNPKSYESYEIQKKLAVTPKSWIRGKKAAPSPEKKEERKPASSH